jgi:hypothetical protein
MEAVRESWTDNRMDALNRRVGDGFTQVDQRFDRVEADLRDLRVETRTEFAAVRQESAALRQEMNARFDAMQRLILQVGGGMIATTMAGFLGLVAAQL